MEKLKLENLTLTYVDGNGSYTPFEKVNLSVAEGEFVCIIGPSGCGKSSLLSVIEGLNKAASEMTGAWYFSTIHCSHGWTLFQM